ncbi:MAG: DMT family transporter [Desulfovibrionaceae bacterium]
MERKAIAALAMTLCFWASAFVAIRVALAGGFGPGHLALFRFLVGSAAMGVLVAVRGGARLPRWRDMPVALVHGFLGFFVYHVALNWGERTVSAASACFLVGSIPVFMAVLAVVLLKERLTPLAWAGMAVSMAGVACIALGEGGGLRIDTGALLVLLAALGVSLYYVLIQPYLARYGSLGYTAVTMWLGTACMLIFTPGLGQTVSQASAEAVLAVVYLGVCPGALAYAGWNYAISRGNVARIGATQFLMPGITIVIGWAWLGELPSRTALAGGCIALAGVVVVTRSRRNR